MSKPTTKGGAPLSDALSQSAPPLYGPFSQSPPTTLLGGRSAAEFLTGFWHKKPLLVRNAFPGFTGAFDSKHLFELACREDVESRLVMRSGTRWTVRQGPLRRADLKALPKRNWTLLVHGVNLYDAEADALLRRFSFLPYARLDDLMVSYAAPGGSVGAHVDSYDVFLLQGAGRRRWQYGQQHDVALRANLPLKILKSFEPQHEEVLAPGDMLYLPPYCAHHGIAVDTCTTWSIGFRAASGNELGAAFLDYLRDHIDLAGRYADPDLVPTRSPARIPAAMVTKSQRLLAGIRWDRSAVRRFLGCWLSEPKPTVFFEPPAAPLGLAAFARQAAKKGLRLNERTQLFYDEQQLFINGEALPWPRESGALLTRLANRRVLTPRDLAEQRTTAAGLLYDWYRNGFLDLGTA